MKYCALTTIPISLQSFVLPFLEELKKIGYDVHVSCAEDEKFATMVEGKFTYFPLDIERGFNLPKTVKNIFVLWKYFRKEKFDMIEYGTENVALCAAIAGCFAGIPIRIYNHWGSRYVGFTGISRFISICIERLAALFSTDVRQVSYRNASMCIEDKIYPAKKVKVLGKGGTIGVDFSIFDVENKLEYTKEIRQKYNIPDNAFLFGFVGRIQKDKGINELLFAFKKICESDKNAYLMIVGGIDTDNPEQILELDWAKHCPNIIFTGFVSDTYRYMSSFDVLVHPTYREGFGMVLQEAAAVKTPIITTDIMGPGEFIKNQVTGILVQPKLEQELYKAMQSLKQNEELRDNFAENGYEYTRKNFERSVMIKRIIEDREELRKNYLNRKGNYEI